MRFVVPRVNHRPSTLSACMPSAAALCVAIAVAGCTDTHKLVRPTESAAPLSAAASGYVALPADGRYGDTLYSGSGMQTAQGVATAFARYLKAISVATAIEDVETARRSAQEGGYDYLLFPQILHWEDRATEWSGKSDRISVKLSVIRTENGEVVDSAVVDGKSKWMTMGGDHPQDLLAAPFNEYSKKLFAR